MVGAKREFPFQRVGRWPAKVQKEDTQSIYEATLTKLKHGALASLRPCVWLGEQHGVKNPNCNEIADRQGENRARNAEGIESVEALTRCYICTSRLTSTTCCHCARRCCETCTRQCDGCGGLFCSVCCTANYDERNDRSFCFECTNGGASIDRAPTDSVREIPSPATLTRFRQSTLDFLLRGAQTPGEDHPCSMEIM